MEEDGEVGDTSHHNQQQEQLTLACRLGKEGRESETSLQRKGSDYIVVSCSRIGHQYEVKKRRKKGKEEEKSDKPRKCSSDLHKRD